MKKALIFLFLLGTIQSMAQDSTSIRPSLSSATDSIDYFFGLNMGYSLGNNPYIRNPELVLEGFQHSLRGLAEADPKASQEILRALLTTMAQNSAPQQSAEALENLNKGEAFLKENGSREGIKTTASGLQYEVVSQGSGPKPGAASTVEVHYEGTLIDGTQFDSSYDRGESISFPLNRVIRGWTEGVQLMNTGSIYKFYIPAELAYGARGQGSIPPNSVLIFKIELLGIK